MMPDKVRMIAPHLTVLMDDGAVLEVQADNRDMLDYEFAARKRGWPAPQDGGQVLWMTYLAWHGLQREGQIGKEVTWDEFRTDLCVHVDPVVETVDPTSPVPGTG